MTEEERRPPAVMATRPVVLPQNFSGDTSWEWESHFQNVAAVNNWTEEDKLKWRKVRLTGRAQTAFKRLPAESQGEFHRGIHGPRP